MLGRLFKYEFKATGRLMGPIYLALIIMCIVSSLFFHFSPEDANNNFILTVIILIMFTLFVFIMAASIVLSYVVSIYRFKKNIFDNEGYLMNTLPLTPGQNIRTKLITSVIYQIFSILIAIISFFAFIIGVSLGDGTGVLQDFFKIFPAIADSMTPKIALFLTEFTILCIISLITLNTKFYAALSIGHSTNKNKFLKSVGVYIIFYIAENIIDSIILVIMGLNIIDIEPGIIGNTFPYMMFGGLISLEAIYFIIYYLITNYFLKRKLNLQ